MMLGHSICPAGQSLYQPGRIRLFFVGILVCIQFILAPGTRVPGVEAQNGPSTAPKQTGLPEMFAEVEQMWLIAELIRHHMGSPVAAPVGITVENVFFQDLYCQARTLLDRTDRLAFETIRLNVHVPPLGAGTDEPAELLKLLQAARASLLRVMQELIPGTAVPPARVEPGKTSGGLFIAIQGLNKQLDLLLERQCTPTDIYAELTLAVGYGARLLSAYPNVELIPPEPAREEGRMMPDVYLRLLQCLDLIAAISRSAEMEVLQVEASGLQTETISVSEVYDLSVAIVARLDALHKLFRTPQPPPAYYPGRRYPADLHQRAALLMAQLQQLSNLAQTQGVPSARKKAKGS